jgi:GTP-binding protein EngB required for normal cell division
MKPTTYQQCRQELLARIDKLRDLRDELASRDAVFVNHLPSEVRQRMMLLDRESTRLRNPDLTVAFVGGFSAGKSSLVNAFLGRYLLPESTKVTTAVPTFVRNIQETEDEKAELHYLTQDEVEKLGELYRKEIATVFQMPELANMPFSALLERVKPLAAEGRGRRLVENFQIYYDQKQKRSMDARGRVVTISIPEAQDKIRDETEAMFLDRIVLRIHAPQLPEDIVLVDLPGISVPNPRHRDITFRFVREDAHAIVFVLMATRLFDKDEIEIMELFRSGETRIVEKTFWVLNRWDSLTTEQQRQTQIDFEQKMEDFGIPEGYHYFRTNALHGLLAQLASRNVPTEDPALNRHWRDYQNSLEQRYGGSHETALRESQVPALQQHVLDFLNNRLRITTLRSSVDNARNNFISPIVHHLRVAMEKDENRLNHQLRQQEKDEVREQVEKHFEERKEELTRLLQEMRSDVAEKRSASLMSKTEDLLRELQNKINDGEETDAYKVYMEIVTGPNLRSYPYHFEIEMRIVDKLNAMLKREFHDIVLNQAEEIFAIYANKAKDFLEKIREDVNYDREIIEPFEEALVKGKETFTTELRGHVKTIVGDFDKLLVYKPKRYWLWGGNPILEGLEKAARLGSDIIIYSEEQINPQHFREKTVAIRRTLGDYYIKQVREEHKTIARKVPLLIINNLQAIEQRLLSVLQSKYRTALETIMTDRVSKDYQSRRQEIEQRSRRFREMIEQTEGLLQEMVSILAKI